MHRFYFIIALLLLSGLLRAEEPLRVSIPAAIEPGGGLTLPVAMAMALSAGASLVVVTHEREAQAAAQLQAAARPNPTLSTLVEDTRGSTRQTTIQIDQPLELGNKQVLRVEAAAAGYHAASADMDRQRAAIRAAVLGRFYEVLIAQEQVQLAQSSLALARQATRAAARRVEAGKVSPVEESKARIADSTAQITLAQMSARLAAARQQLSLLWGESVPGFARVDGQKDALPYVPGLSELSAQLEHAPFLQRARLEIERREALVKVEISKRTPDLTVSVGARRNEELGLNQAILGVSLPIPLFDRNQGNLQEAVSRTDKARAELEQARIEQQQQLSAVHERFSTARQTVELLRDDVLPDIQSTYTAVMKGFEFGKFSFLEVLDTQRTLFQTKSQYLDSLLTAYQAAADIERITGASLDAWPAIAVTQYGE